ncbi:MAG: aminotransferase class V-fold PLP-dependent enzyme [Thermoplasmata archaeon]|nr:aminotransferase class V-fold PLP-dependent enzyme [Thermoplasmata archaeon]
MEESLLTDAAVRAHRYRQSLPSRGVVPAGDAVEAVERLCGSLPEEGEDPSSILQRLDEFGSPATVSTAGGRYFGFVIGSSLPAALAANWLAGAWDQNAAVQSMSPVAARLETTALAWIGDLLGIPPTARGAFVTGATMANFSGLAAARHALLEAAGWYVEARGLFGAPPVTVIVGDEVHVSVLKALSLLGFGRDRVVRVPADDQGRMRTDRLPEIHGPTVVCAQAGNVNTGAFDPARELCEWAHRGGAWVHFDAAFGLWAHASPGRRALTAGIDGVDSWAVDAHKWLNVPYDSGVVFVRDGRHLRAAMSGAAAAYLPQSTLGEAMEYTPEMSRRARGVDAWAALRSLGRAGIADLVERCCRHATRMASLLRTGGCRILNEVVLNQVLVSFGSDERTRRVIDAVQRDGTCWCGGTVWHGTAAMRISLSSWATTDDDVDRSAAAIVRVASTTPA